MDRKPRETGVKGSGLIKDGAMLEVGLKVGPHAVVR